MTAPVIVGGMVNANPLLLALANVVILSPTMNSLGITKLTQVCYPAYSVSINGLPAVRLETVTRAGGRATANGTAGRGQIRVYCFLPVTTDIGTIEGYADSIIDDFCEQIFTNTGSVPLLNIIDVEVSGAEEQDIAALAGGEAGQPDQAGVQYNAFTMLVTWE